MRRIVFFTAIIGVCVLMLAGGCAKKSKIATDGVQPTAKEMQKPTGKPVDLSLKFNVGDTTAYKVVVESIKDYKFEQPSINQTKTQQTLSMTEIVYDQKIESVDPNGNAKALITVKEIRYLSKNPKGTAFDFDSAKDTEKKNAMSNLVGQTYVITMSPAGEVVAVGEVQKALDAVKGDSMEHKVAQSLLTDESIKQRHTVVALPDKKDLSAKVGASWSRIKGSPAGMLQPKSYEKIYTLSEVQKGQVAVVSMDAQPTSQKAADVAKDEQKGMGFFAKMFDNKETYTGKLTMDTQGGKVDGYSEQLKSEWVAVEPSEEVKSDKGPDVLTMGFTYRYSIERIK